jgi:hypothetical protein
VATIALPRWIVNRKCINSGRRLFPKPLLPIEAPPVDSRLPAHYQGNPTATRNTLPGDFENAEYRFWGPVTRHLDSMIIAWQCRACSTILLSKEDRKKHQEEKQCTIKLVGAYQILLEKGFCVICNVYTKNKGWGVPLCSDVCKTKFTSDQDYVQSGGLHIALETIRLRKEASEVK